MGLIKKNKIHNPQIITDAVPSTISDNDIGRLWIDKSNNTISIAIGNKDTGIPELRNILDTSNYTEMDLKYFTGVEEEMTQIVSQEVGDKHYDYGYDFFTDELYLKNTTQEIDDYYSYFYKEVPDTTSNGYLRTISTDNGVKHIRTANGKDTYIFNSVTYNLVNYSKINLNKPAKEIISISFDNKDQLTNGYELTQDKKTILIYADPDGAFINKNVKVKYLI